MSGSFIADIMPVIVVQILNQAGFDKAHQSACLLLADLLVRYLDRLSVTAAAYAALQGRTAGNFLDIAISFEDLGVAADTLIDFCKGWADHGTDPVLNLDEMLRQQQSRGNEHSPSESRLLESSGRVPNATQFRQPPSFYDYGQLNGSCNVFPTDKKDEEIPSKQSGQEAAVAGKRSKKRKCARYDCIAPFKESNLALCNFHPSHQASKARRLCVEYQKRGALLESALSARTKDVRLLPSKRMLSLLQQRQKTQAVPSISLCGGSSDAGVLDDLLALELSGLPGLLEGQPPPAAVGLSIARSKLGGGTHVGWRLQSSQVPDAAAGTVADEDNAPKIKLKLNLPGTRSGSHVSHAVYTGDDVINCICANPHIDDGGFMIACDRCGAWFHGHCVGVPSEGAQGVGDWFCPRCKNP